MLATLGRYWSAVTARTAVSANAIEGDSLHRFGEIFHFVRELGRNLVVEIIENLNEF